jgi:hypothetical protein
MKPVLRLYFADMWGHGPYQFNMHDNYFTDLFSLKYDVIIDSNNPDILLYSCFGLDHRKFSCFKIFFSGENIPSRDTRVNINPDYSECNLSLSKFSTSTRNYYFPLWALFVNWFSKYQPRPLPSNPTYSVPIKDLMLTASSRSLPGYETRQPVLFINNNLIKNRVMLFLDLEAAIPVHSYGRLFNNVESGPIRGTELDKHNLMLGFRFTISMENSFFNGYNTEKIIQPYCAGSIPIYSGGLDTSIFNKRSLILEQDYASRADLVDEILKINSSQCAWEDKLSEPLFCENKIPDQFYPESVLYWIERHI